MKESVQRIRLKGKSSLLIELADRAGAIENVPISIASQTNVVLDSIIGMESVVPPSQEGIVLDSMIGMEPVVSGRVVVQCDDDFISLDDEVEVVEVRNRVCNNEVFDEWEVDEYVKLRELTVGDECFQYVKDLKIVGLNELEKVEIGKQCFCRTTEGVFELENCEKLESVKIGDGSFVGVVSVVFESECCIVC